MYDLKAPTTILEYAEFLPIESVSFCFKSKRPGRISSPEQFLAVVGKDVIFNFSRELCPAEKLLAQTAIKATTTHLRGKLRHAVHHPIPAKFYTEVIYPAMQEQFGVKATTKIDFVEGTVKIVDGAFEDLEISLELA